MSNKKYKPRTEAQKIARRERDRKRREEAKSNTAKSDKKVNSKCTEYKIATDDIHIGIVAVAGSKKKRLVKVTVVKEYEVD